MRTALGAFIVNQECIFTLLIPLYRGRGAPGAARMEAPDGDALGETRGVFALGLSRLLVLAVPGGGDRIVAVAIHAFA